jgi:hypothetical protein
VLGASAALGVNVATVPAAFSATVPDTGVLPATTWNVVDPPTTARSKPAETVVPSATPVAPGAGDSEVTDGALAVVNDHDTGLIEAPAAFVAPAAVTV